MYRLLIWSWFILELQIILLLSLISGYYCEEASTQDHLVNEITKSIESSPEYKDIINKKVEEEILKRASLA